MLNKRKRAEELSSRSRAKRATVVGMSFAGATLAALATSMPAGAETFNTNAPTANNTIIGSGSSTDYNMMQAIDLIFNQTPGCNITSGAVSGAPSPNYQQLDFSCEMSTVNGQILQQQPASNFSYMDNPANDIAVEEAPMGSSNGIAQLENDQKLTGVAVGGSNSTENISAINFARSSRDPSGSDNKGLTFVAYAKDGVAPFFFSLYGNKVTLPGQVAPTTLTGSELAGIYDGEIYDWGQLGATTTRPIFIYSAQEGSGTQAPCKGYLDPQSGYGVTPSFDPSASTNLVNCKDPVLPGSTTSGVTFPSYSTLTGCKGPDIIFENEDASILGNASPTTRDAIATAWLKLYTATPKPNPVSDAMFFYSPGKFAEQCAGLTDKVKYLDGSIGENVSYGPGHYCGSVKLPSGDAVQLGEVNGQTANPQTILSDTYPITRFLYNVYSNGSNAPTVPEASAATLNYVSEVGFICKAQTTDGSVETNLPATTRTVDTNAKDIVDPATGYWYHDEIFNAIVGSGFIPTNATTTGTGYGDIVDGPAFQEDTNLGGTSAGQLLQSAPGGSTYLTAGPGGVNGSINTGTNPYGFCIATSTNAN